MKTNDKLRDRTGRISGRKVRLAKDTAKLRAFYDEGYSEAESWIKKSVLNR